MASSNQIILLVSTLILTGLLYTLDLYYKLEDDPCTHFNPQHYSGKLTDNWSEPLDGSYEVGDCGVPDRVVDLGDNESFESSRTPALPHIHGL